MALSSERRGGLAEPRSAHRAPRGIGAAVGLGVLAIIPLAAGTLRLVQLAGGPAVIPADPRFDALPVAVVLHITGSALWLTVLYDAQPGTGPLLFVARVVFLMAMAFSLLRGFTAIRQRDIPTHRAWMMRGYAIALGAGTQVITEGIGEAALGPGILVGDLAKGAGWVINLLIAEWLIRASVPTRVARGGER